MALRSEAQLLRSEGADHRRSRHILAFPALLIVALFGVAAGVGGSLPGGFSLGKFGVNIIESSRHTDGMNMAGSLLPTLANLPQSPDEKTGKTRVNDSDPRAGIDPWDEVWRDFMPLGNFIPNVHTYQHPNTLGGFLFPCIYQGPENVLSQSPFCFLVTIQLFLFTYLHWKTKEQSFLTSSRFLWLLLAAAVLPVCAVQSDRYLRSRLISPHVRWSSSTSRVVSNILHRRLWSSRARRGYFTFFPFDPGISDPKLYIPWDKDRGIGEALNPGPVVKLSTLLSASKNQDIILQDASDPTVQVFTETCMTKVTLDTLSRRAKGKSKNLIPGALCNPRQNIIRGSSYTRGQSGGVLVVSDLPSRPGNSPLPVAAWASTRLVDAVVQVAPGIFIRIIGIYGVTAKIKTHADMTNELLCHALATVKHSSLPCVVMGDFNCPLDELAIWPDLFQRGWVDCAAHHFYLTGQPPAMTFRQRRD